MARRPDPVFGPETAPERETLEGMLDFYRAVIARKLEGLDEAAARRPFTPSGMSAIGVVNHLIGVELWWYVEVLEGGRPDYPWSEQDLAADRDCDWKPPDSRTVAVVLAEYDAACAIARAAAARHDLDEIVPEPKHDRTMSLRWIHVHMIEECARHAGHLDIMRELLDGTTGD